MSSSGDQGPTTPPKGTTARLIAILDTFRQTSKVDQGVTDIAERTGLDKSVVHRMVGALSDEGFLVQDQDSRRFRVGMRMWEVGQRYLDGMDNLIEVSHRRLEELLAEHAGTGYVGRLDGGQVTYLATIKGPGPLQVNVDVGTRIPPYASSLGKAILAWLPEDHPARQFTSDDMQPLTPSTITDPEELRKDLARTRERGYATNHQEQVAGVGGIGVPILTRDGRPQASISIGFPLLPDYDRLWTSLPGPLMETARRIASMTRVG